MFLGQATVIPKSVTCKSDDGKEVSFLSVKELSAQSTNLHDFKFATLANGVKYLRVPTMPYEINSDMKQALKTLADEITDSPLVIDLRGNRGGDNIFADELEKALRTTSEKNTDIGVANKISPLASISFLNRFFSFLIRSEHGDQLANNTAGFKSAREFAKNATSTMNWGQTAVVTEPSTEVIGRRIQGRTKPIIALYDKECASACETIFDRLRTHPKTVFVGTPSYGATHISNSRFLVLPNSKIVVSLGFHLTVYPEAIETPEMFGHMPDYLGYDADPEHLLNAVIDFANQ